MILIDGRQDSILTLSLNRPEVLNAFNQEMRIALARALREADGDDTVRVIVLEGRGRAFSAGQDQRESATMADEQARARLDAYAEVADALRSCSKPIIAKIHGYAAGSAFQMALRADLRIAGTSARMGLTELNIGSVALNGSTIARQVLGEATMKRLVMTAELIDAAEAYRLNAVHEVVPDEQLDSRVAAIAGFLAGHDRFAVAVTKRWWQQMTEDELSRSREYAYSGHAANFEQGTSRRGAKKFVEGKRSVYPSLREWEA